MRSAAVTASRIDHLLLTLLAASLLTNVVLGVHVLRSPTTPPHLQAGSLPLGAQVPPRDGYDRAGAPQTVAFEDGGRPTLLYVYSPSCAWCASNVRNVVALFAATKDTHRNVALSVTTEAGRDAEVFKPYAVVLSRPSRAVIDAYRLGATPIMLLISPEGRVVKTWIGAWIAKNGDEIEEHFALRLPGVSREGNESPDGEKP